MVERFHETLTCYLARQPPADSLAILQLQLDAFGAYYNTERPHRALKGATPAVVFETRINGCPVIDRTPVWFRVRQDRVSKAGNVTVRNLSRLRHIGLGRAHAGKEVRLQIADAHVRVVGADGSLLRELVLDADRDYQPRLHSSSMS
jgi:Integrase core domain